MNLIRPSSSRPPSSSSSISSPLKFSHPKPHLFSKRTKPKLTKPNLTTIRNAIEPTPRTQPPESNTPISLLSQDDVPLEGVIRFPKPGSSKLSSLITKWGRVALLAGGDVSALLLFSSIGRFSHGFSVFDIETFKTADPFIAGWFLSAYFLGGYSEDGRGMNGYSKAVTAAVKSWTLGIPGNLLLHRMMISSYCNTGSPHVLTIEESLGLVIRTATVGHILPTNFMLVTMGSTALLLIGWRSLLFKIISSADNKKDDVYKKGSPFEFLELLTSLVRRW